MRDAAKMLAKIAAYLAVVMVATTLYFADNILGYYRFKALCQSEGGLQVLSPLSKGAGWLVPSGNFSFAALSGVAFVRFVDKSGISQDVRYLGGLVSDERSFEFSRSDESRPVTYQVRRVSERVPERPRTFRSGYAVTEISTGKLLVRWYQIGYNTFDQDSTLLGAPSGNSCHSWGDFYLPVNQAKYFTN